MFDASDMTALPEKTLPEQTSNRVIRIHLLTFLWMSVEVAVSSAAVGQAGVRPYSASAATVRSNCSLQR